MKLFAISFSFSLIFSIIDNEVMLRGENLVTLEDKRHVSYESRMCALDLDMHKRKGDIFFFKSDFKRFSMSDIHLQRVEKLSWYDQKVSPLPLSLSPSFENLCFETGGLKCR